MSVHKQRILAFQAMYMYECNIQRNKSKKNIELNKNTVKELFLLPHAKDKSEYYAITLFDIALCHRKNIDDMLYYTIMKYFFKTISFKNITTTLLSILRIAFAELFFLVPLKNQCKIQNASVLSSQNFKEHVIKRRGLVIDEAIIIAKTYAEDNAYKLVHALLDKACTKEE